MRAYNYATRLLTNVDLPVLREETTK